MMLRRRRGFTLIELLVVIAIIGILAAMLFPVFARARESARKIQCLSNVKNIALAINMYLTDYDAFPPQEHRAEVADYFAGRGCGDVDAQWYADQANPYLKWPVVLDEYIKNRDVWNCPSAKWINAADFIVGGGGDWLTYMANNESAWGWDAGNFGPCGHNVFPSGWGGDITDSIAQGARAGAEYSAGSHAAGAFITGIATAQENFFDMKLSVIADASAAPICSDGGASPTWLSGGTVAYPDICAAECCGFVAGSTAWGWPTADCPDGSTCAECAEAHAGYWSVTQGEGVETWDKRFTRHLGGVNVGFADGHAQWFRSRAFLASLDQGNIKNIGFICSPYTSSEGFQANCGSIEPGMSFMYSKPRGFWGN